LGCSNAHLPARALIDLVIADAIACFAIDLMEVDFLAFAVAGKSEIGQDTRERRKYPFQYARGAMVSSYEL
jgi:hypothetical protein